MSNYKVKMVTAHKNGFINILPNSHAVIIINCMAFLKSCFYLNSETVKLQEIGTTP